MEHEGSLPHSQVLANCPYPEPARSSPYPNIPFPTLTPRSATVFRQSSGFYKGVRRVEAVKYLRCVPRPHMESKSKKQKITFCSQGQWFSRQVFLEGLSGGFYTVYYNCVSTFRGDILHPSSGWVDLIEVDFEVGTTVAQWLRCCATNRKVAGSIQAGVIGIFHWHKILPITLWPWGQLSL